MRERCPEVRWRKYCCASGFILTIYFSFPKAQTEQNSSQQHRREVLRGTSSTFPAETEIFPFSGAWNSAQIFSRLYATSGTDFLPTLKEERKPVPLREWEVSRFIKQFVCRQLSLLTHHRPSHSPWPGCHPRCDEPRAWAPPASLITKSSVRHGAEGILCCSLTLLLCSGCPNLIERERALPQWRMSIDPISLFPILLFWKFLVRVTALWFSEWTWFSICSRNGLSPASRRWNGSVAVSRIPLFQ